MGEELIARVKEALDAGKVDEARDLVRGALHDNPDDPELRETFTDLQLARAIHLASAAREARRKAIVRLAIPYDTEFEDEAEVEVAFDESLAAIEEVLAVSPTHEKARTMKASVLFRRDRKKGRPAALAILREIESSNPANRQVAYAIKRIEAPCARCRDSGFCLRCRGRGSRRLLGVESRCETCHGQGICPACGIL